MEQQQQQPSRRRRRRGESEAEGTSTGRDDESSSSIDTRWPLPVYTVTIDPQGGFHVSPSVGRGGPFRSVGEAFAETRAACARHPHINYLWVSSPRPGAVPPAAPCIARIYTRSVELRPETAPPSPWSSWKYHVTLRDGLFYARPPDIGGPFHSLGEAAASIKDHNTWASATQLLTKDYYLTLKDGLFHVHPNCGMGGPFKRLDDATDAIRFDRDWRQERKERNRKVKEFLDNLDPAVYIARIKDLTEAIRSGKRDPEPEPMNAVASSESEDCDPEISEVIDRMERLLDRRNAIRDGMRWMKSEALEAFEFYKASIGYQGPKYEFVKLDRQCLIYDSFSEQYHHYNFTMKRKSSFYLSKKAKRSLKRPSTRAWDYQLFFAEVKSAEKGKQIICCPLRSGENGHCFGCQNVGIDLGHPASGGYEEGHEESGFPFDSDSGSDIE